MKHNNFISFVVPGNYDGSGQPFKIHLNCDDVLFICSKVDGSAPDNESLGYRGARIKLNQCDVHMEFFGIDDKALINSVMKSGQFKTIEHKIEANVTGDQTGLFCFNVAALSCCKETEDPHKLRFHFKNNAEITVKELLPGNDIKKILQSTQRGNRALPRL